MSAKKTNNSVPRYEVNKTSYEKVTTSIEAWPQWKKELCNDVLIVSAHAKKI